MHSSQYFISFEHEKLAWQGQGREHGQRHVKSQNRGAEREEGGLTTTSAAAAAAWSGRLATSPSTRNHGQ